MLNLAGVLVPAQIITLPVQQPNYGQALTDNCQQQWNYSQQGKITEKGKQAQPQPLGEELKTAQEKRVPLKQANVQSGPTQG